MSLVTTPGAANANSYADLDEALAYNSSRLYASAWEDADEAEREQALQMATSLLDAKYVWTGVATNETQALGWPRVGMKNRNGFAIADSVIPQALKDATSEFARQLLGTDRTVDNDIEIQGITGIKAGPVSLTFKDDIEAGSREQVIPSAVHDLIPPSWYTVTTTQPAVFRAV